MCNVKDAQRQEALAEKYAQNKSKNSNHSRVVGIYKDKHCEGVFTLENGSLQSSGVLDPFSLNKIKAREHYLEAVSIYVLNAELQKDNSLLQQANRCYQKAQLMLGNIQTENLTKAQLARITLDELNPKDLLEQIKIAIEEVL